MDFKEYMQEAIKTAEYPKDYALQYLIPGLCSEAGEVAGAYKRLVRGDYAFPTFLEKVIPELGDTLWYLSMVCFEIGIELEDVAKENVKKLKERQKIGNIKGEGGER